MSLVIRSKKIWVSSSPVDFRRAINGLCTFIIEAFQMKPQEGLFIFYNTQRNRLKMLMWHHNGFLLMYKRLEKGRFPFRFSENPGKIVLNEKQLQGLLLGLDWQAISDWAEIDFESYF